MSPTEIEPERTTVLTNGSRVVLRPIRPDDQDALVEFHEHLSSATIHSRFFGAHPHLRAAEAHKFACVDHRARTAFVAYFEDRLVGVGRYEQLDASTAEVALVVADDFQHLGLGAALFRAVVAHARRCHISRLRAQVFTDNQTMLRLFRHAGLSCAFVRDGDETVVDIEIDSSSSRDPSDALEGA